MPGTQLGDRRERLQGADSTEAQRGRPEHHPSPEEGDREGMEDGRCEPREGVARQGDDPAAQARDRQPHAASGAGRWVRARRGVHRERAPQAEGGAHPREGHAGRPDRVPPHGAPGESGEGPLCRGGEACPRERDSGPQGQHRVHEGRGRARDPEEAAHGEGDEGAQERARGSAARDQGEANGGLCRRGSDRKAAADAQGCQPSHREGAEGVQHPEREEPEAPPRPRGADALEHAAPRGEQPAAGRAQGQGGRDRADQGGGPAAEQGEGDDDQQGEEPREAEGGDRADEGRPPHGDRQPRARD
mmetsp:Transcript_9904/g.23649  ORF Transcript_9904/g.23649 Transcript_9904/m.23649 type:complete len:303 (+) Transcript_9904:481-1389(+)